MNEYKPLQTVSEYISYSMPILNTAIDELPKGHDAKYIILNPRDMPELVNGGMYRGLEIVKSFFCPLNTFVISPTLIEYTK